jgi:hypothetical protein
VDLPALAPQGSPAQPIARPSAISGPNDDGSPCAGYERRQHEKFCTRWDEAYKAYGDGEWEIVVDRGTKAKSIGPGHPGLDRIMAFAGAAIERGYTGLYRHLMTDCPAEIPLGWPNSAYQALRCTGSKPPRYSDPDSARRVVRPYLNDETHDLETTRAVYVHLCARSLKNDEGDDEPLYPERVLGCA